MEGNAVFPVTGKDSQFLRLLIVMSLSSLMALFLWLIIETEASAAGWFFCQPTTDGDYEGLEKPQIVFFPAWSGKEEACSLLVATVAGAVWRVCRPSLVNARWRSLSKRHLLRFCHRL